MSKHSGKKIKIGKQEYWLASIVQNGKTAGYILQPVDEFQPPDKQESKK